MAEIKRPSTQTEKQKNGEKKTKRTSVKKAPLNSRKKGSLKNLSKGKKIALALLIIFVLALIGGSAAFAIMYTQVPELDTNNFTYIENAKILDVDGNFYQDLQSSEKREVVSIEEIPQSLQNAFISIEDQRFKTHNGVDLRRLGRAVLDATTSGSLDGPGGSTITQQLIKLTHLTSDKTIIRKFQEMILASRLEKVYTKDQILEAYLNKINLSQAWGVQAASRVYFGKNVGELSVAQSAILASIANSPSYYDPYTYTKNDNGEKVITVTTDGIYPLSDNNRMRSLLVIEKMYELGYIDQSTFNQSKNELDTNQVGLTYSELESEYKYSYFTDSVYSQVLTDLIEKYHYTEEVASNYLLNGSLTVYSTVNPKIQSIMEVKAFDDNLYPSQSYSAAAASSSKSADTGESYNYIPQVGMTIIDNKTGHVSGIVGGRDEKTNLSLNRATRKFQPGSSTKPLTAYGPGLDSGAITLGTVYEDVPISYTGWRPQNSSGGFGGPTTIRQGLTESINTIAVQANVATGLDVAADYGTKLGLDIIKEGDYNDMTPAALALGGYTHGQSSLAMANAFSNFPNGGTRTDPTFYTKVLDSSGKVILENKPKSTQVFKPQTAYLITDVLQSAVNGGTTNISVPGQPVAGKTGTTDDERHAWFCGYTPYYSMAVWYGYDDNVVETTEDIYYLNIGVFGGSKPGPAYMFEQVMADVHADLPSASFPDNPGDISTATIDRVSGKLATNLTTRDPRGSMATNEMFINGTVPTSRDDWHVEVELDTSTNCYKTPYCPANLIQKVVRINKPLDRFPAGITPLDPNYSTQSESAVLLPSNTQTCPVHTTPTNAEIGLSVGGGAIGGTITMKVGNSIVMAANGPSNNATAFTSSSDAVSLSPNGNQVTITASKPGQTKITVTQVVTAEVMSGSERKTYETTYSKVVTINVTE